LLDGSDWVPRIEGGRERDNRWERRGRTETGRDRAGHRGDPRWASDSTGIISATDAGNRRRREAGTLRIAALLEGNWRDRGGSGKQGNVNSSGRMVGFFFRLICFPFLMTCFHFLRLKRVKGVINVKLISSIR